MASQGKFTLALDCAEAQLEDVRHHMDARSIPVFMVSGLAGLVVAGCQSDPSSVVPLQEARQVTIPYSESPDFLHGHPGIEASINGVAGRFMIDTGTGAPILSKEAVRLCSLKVRPSLGNWWNGGSNAPMDIATNVTVWLGKLFEIHWPEVAVFSWEDKADTNFFGILDYGTLQASHTARWQPMNNFG